MGAQERANAEQEAKAQLHYRGYEANFADTVNMRDHLEQMVGGLAHVHGNTPVQQRAVSEYLSAIQQPDIKPETLIRQTDKFLDQWRAGENPNRKLEASEVNYINLAVGTAKIAVAGIAAHNNMDPNTGSTNYGAILGEKWDNLFPKKSEAPNAAPVTKTAPATTPSTSDTGTGNACVPNDDYFKSQPKQIQAAIVQSTPCKV